MTVQRVDELDVVCVVPLGAQNAVEHLCGTVARTRAQRVRRKTCCLQWVESLTPCGVPLPTRRRSPLAQQLGRLRPPVATAGANGKS